MRAEPDVGPVVRAPAHVEHHDVAPEMVRQRLDLPPQALAAPRPEAVNRGVLQIHHAATPDITRPRQRRPATPGKKPSLPRARKPHRAPRASRFPKGPRRNRHDFAHKVNGRPQDLRREKPASTDRTGTKSPSPPEVGMEKQDRRPRGTRLLTKNHPPFSEGCCAVRKERDPALGAGLGGRIGRRHRFRSRQASAAVLKAIWTCSLS